MNERKEMDGQKRSVYRIHYRTWDDYFPTLGTASGLVVATTPKHAYQLLCVKLGKVLHVSEVDFIGDVEVSA